MNSATLSIDERLICALDTADANEAKAIITELDGVVSFYKVGMTLHLATGLEIVKLLLDSGKRVFLDLKYYDIPETVRKTVAVAAGLGIDFLTIHGSNATAEAAVAGRGDSNLKLLAVTVLTSFDQEGLGQLGYEGAIQDLVLHRAEAARACGVDGVVASAQEVAMIKQATHGELLVVTPGIREANACADDQTRIVTPKDAIAAGSDFLVVGRPITSPQDGFSRREVAQRIIAQMRRAEESV
jgi:orotidine-5'-phosphate decarboxylase